MADPRPCPRRTWPAAHAASRRLALAGIAAVTVMLAGSTASGQERTEGPRGLVQGIEDGWRWRIVDECRGAVVTARVAANGPGSFIWLAPTGVRTYDGLAVAELTRQFSSVGPSVDAIIRTDAGTTVVNPIGVYQIAADGHVIERFRLPADSTVTGTAITPDGTIMVGTAREIITLSRSGSHTSIERPPGVHRMISLVVDDRGRTWCSTDHGVWLREEGADWRLATLPAAAGQLSSGGSLYSGGGAVYVVPRAPDETQLVSCCVGDRWTQVDLGNQARAISDATVLPDGVLVAITRFGQLICSDGTRTSHPKIRALESERLMSVASLPDGRLAVSTGVGRLFTCDLASRRWTVYPVSPEPGWNVVNVITPSRRGGWWIGTGVGVCYFDGTHCQEFTEVVRGTRLGAITAIAEDQDGRVWIGSGGSFVGTYVFDGTTWSRPKGPPTLEGEFVHGIRCTGDGELWFLTLGPCRYSRAEAGHPIRRQNGKWRVFGPEDGLPATRCYDFFRDSAGRGWLGTTMGTYAFKDERFAPLGGDPDQRSFQFTESGALGLVSCSGPFWFGMHRVTDGGDRSFNHPRLKRIGVRSALRGGDGRLWLASDVALSTFDGTDLHDVTAEPGAPPRDYWPLTLDRDGSILAGSFGGGIVRYRPDDSAPPQVIAAATQVAEDGKLAITWHAADPWNVTPEAQLRYRVRVDGGPFGPMIDGALYSPPDLAAGRHQIEIAAYDLAGNASREPWLVHLDIPQPAFLRAPAFGFEVAALILASTTVTVWIRRRREASLLRWRERCADSAMRASEARFRSIVATGHDGVWLLTPDLATSYLNDRMAEMLGRPADAALGCPLSELLDQATEGALRDAIAVCGMQGSTQIEIRFRTASGNTCDVLAGIRAIPGPDQAVQGYTLMVTDVTERKRAQAVLLDSQRLEGLGLIAGGIAHDFNNLLVSVIGHASLLRQSLRPSEPAARHVDAIEEVSQRATELCRSLLASAGRAEFIVKPVDLGDLVRETARLLDVSIPQTVSLGVHVAPGTPPALGDRGQLRQLLMNLLLNAVEAIGARAGRIDVCIGARTLATSAATSDEPANATEPGHYVQICVTDNGCGMPPEVKARIFDPFFSTKFTGRGLGLAAVMGIVRGHHGAIDVSSEPGAGTTFSVLLPAAPVATTTAPRPRPAAGRTPHSILVIDDDEGVRSIVRRYLASAGHRIVTADSGEGGLQAYEEARGAFDLVILDLTMPDLDGAAVLERLRAQEPPVKVLVMSGYAESQVADRLGRCQPDGFVGKPFTRTSLMEAIEQVIAGVPAPVG